MPITPDAKWLEAFKLPLRAMIGVTLACCALLWLDNTKQIDLSIFGALTKSSIFVLTVVAGSLALSGVGAIIFDLVTAKKKRGALAERRATREAEAKERSNAAKEAALDRLNYLSPEELRYLTDCLRKGTQSFTTWIHSPYVSTLASKGLIHTPGGTHHMDHFPFTINDFVWKELLRRKDELIDRDDTNKKQQGEQRRFR